MQTMVAALRERLSAARADQLTGRERDLERVLAGLYDDASTRNPGISVDPVQWVTALAVRLPGDLAIEDGLLSCRTGDIFWVCGCLNGDPAALALLETAVREEVTGAGVAVRASADEIDNARQGLHASLLVGEREPGLARYAGRGDLRGFLRIAAVRALLRLKGRREREVGVNPDLLEALAPATDPELERLKQAYRQDFAACFREALAELPPRDRTLLRLNVLEKMSIDKLGVLFGVHRATAARWLERVKAELGTRTEELLAERLGVEAAEVESIIRLVRSQVDVSLNRMLAEPKKID
jgi:RNA polymerase sigma-70 factor (ECF subfamily)